MANSAKPATLSQLLCCDIRFTQPDIPNDQVWKLEVGQVQPTALSLMTTYGLRAKRMHLFPEFSMEGNVLRDPAQFTRLPEVQFASTNFISVHFSPFPSIDVTYRIWVPTSQVLVGEMLIQNSSSSTLTPGVDWGIQLQPIRSGNPMKPVQMGLSTVLQGECEDLFPVFYLTGAVHPSQTALPGLGSKLLLLPNTNKQITWVLASQTSIDSSFQKARQYSSKSLEVEQITIEMADHRDHVLISTLQPFKNYWLEKSQQLASALIMPATRKMAHPTYVSTRGIENGFILHPELLESHTEWAGQTLPEIWQLAQNLLPGQPQVILGLLQNMLDQQQPDGKIDYRVSPSGKPSGLSSPPILAQLTADLLPFLGENENAREVFPRLIAFLKSWVRFSDRDGLDLSPLLHPFQTSLEPTTSEQFEELVDFWFEQKYISEIFLQCLLYREVNDLQQLSRQMEITDEDEWLEKVRQSLAVSLLKTYDQLMTIPAGDSSSKYPLPGEDLRQRIKRNGTRRPRITFSTPQKIFLRLTSDTGLPKDFHCLLSGWSALGKPIELQVTAASLIVMGNQRFFVSPESFSRLDTVEIHGLPVNIQAEFGQAESGRQSIIPLMLLNTGLLSDQQVTALLRKIHLREHLSAAGMTLFAHPSGRSGLRLSPFLCGFIIEGLLRYHKIAPARQAYENQFFTPHHLPLRDPFHRKWELPVSLRDMAPLRLFLSIHGLQRISPREIILTHQINRKQDAFTVQYNQMTLMMNLAITEVLMESGEVISLNQPGSQRILLE
mgnify:CR=1 FL=1